MRQTVLAIAVVFSLAASSAAAGRIGPVPRPVSGPRSAAPSADLPSLVGEVPMGSLSAVAVAGERLYAGLGPRVLTLDASDPTRPRQLSATDVLTDTVRDLLAADGTLYAALGGGGLEVLSLADPNRPLALTRLPGKVTGLAIVGTTLYAAGDTLQILDVADPTRIRLLGRLDRTALRVTASGTRVYLAAGNDGVLMVDAASPAAPRVIGSLDTPGRALDVAAAGNSLFVADRTSFLAVDVTDPTAPKTAASYTPPLPVACYPYVSPEDCRTVERLAVAGGKVYLMLRRCTEAFSCRAPGGVRVLDVSRLPELTELAAFDARGNPTAMAVTDGRVDLAQGAVWWYGGIAPCMLSEGTLTVLDAGLVQLGTHVPLAMARGLAITPGRAWLADPIADLGVLDISDPAAARPVAPDRPVRYVGSGYGQSAATDVSVSAAVAFVTIGPGAGVGAAAAVGARPQNGCAPPPPDQWFNAVELRGDLAYLLDAYGALAILDAATGKRLGRLDSGGAVGLDADGALVVLAQDDAVAVVSVADPAQPRQLASLAGPAHAVSLRGRFAYVAAGEDGLRVLDLGDPTAPAELARLDLPGTAVDLQVEGSLAYVAAEDAGLLVVDVADPRRPQLLGAAGSLTGATHVSAARGVIGALATGGLFLFAGEDPGPTSTPTPTPTKMTPRAWIYLPALTVARGSVANERLDH